MVSIMKIYDFHHHYHSDHDEFHENDPGNDFDNISNNCITINENYHECNVNANIRDNDLETIM